VKDLRGIDSARGKRARTAGPDGETGAQITS
jgi:hypothetical protein